MRLSLLAPPDPFANLPRLIELHARPGLSPGYDSLRHNRARYHKGISKVPEPP